MFSTTRASWKAAPGLQGLAALPGKLVLTGQWAHLALPDGLNVVLERIGECRWRLAIARDGFYPDAAEISSVRAACRAPEAANEQRSVKLRRHAKSGRSIAWHVVEMTWREYPQAERPAPAGKALPREGTNAHGSQD